MCRRLLQCVPRVVVTSWSLPTQVHMVGVAVCCRMLQGVAVWYSVLQCDAECCCMLQGVAVWYSVLQCDAVCVC